MKNIAKFVQWYKRAEAKANTALSSWMAPRAIDRYEATKSIDDEKHGKI